MTLDEYKEELAKVESKLLESSLSPEDIVLLERARTHLQRKIDHIGGPSNED